MAIDEWDIDLVYRIPFMIKRGAYMLVIVGL